MPQSLRVFGPKCVFIEHGSAIAGCYLVFGMEILLTFRWVFEQSDIRVEVKRGGL